MYRLPASLVAALLALLLATPPADAAPGRVFRDRPQQVLPGRHANMAIEGRVDTARVARGSPLLELQLPDGSNVELARQGFRRLHRDSATWRGKVQGYARSDATLSVVNGHLAGRVRIDADVYEIRPLAADEIRLEKLDMDSFPACDGGLPLDPTIADAAQVLVDAGAAQAAAGDEGTPRLDMLVLYTAAAEAKEGAQQIPATVAAAVASLNTVFQNSQVNAEAVLVHAQRIEHTETGYAESLQWLSSDPQVAALRNRYAADMVSLLVDLDSSCGIGWVPRTNAANFNPATAFQVTGIDCAVGNLSFAHESGHNMGMEHNPENSSAAIGQPYGPASYEHSFGHWVAGGANAFRTVMSYADPCGSAFACPREEYFSNPYIDYLGNPTGTLGQPGVVNGRYNALTGNVTAPIIAQYRSPPASSGARDFAIQQGSDDAQQNDVTGEVTDNWVALVTGYYPVDPYPATSVGLRFQSINVPRDATITAAWLEFEAYDDRAGYAASTISVQDADNPATFSTAPFDISARPRGGSLRWDDIPPGPGASATRAWISPPWYRPPWTARAGRPTTPWPSCSTTTAAIAGPPVSTTRWEPRRACTSSTAPAAAPPPWPAAASGRASHCPACRGTTSCCRSLPAWTASPTTAAGRCLPTMRPATATGCWSRPPPCRPTPATGT